MPSPLNPSQAIHRISQRNPEGWFEYPVQAHPHLTDYAGVVWHGAYLTWMEEARVLYLETLGIRFADLVALGCDLPVVELSIRYHRPIRMGASALLKTRMHPLKGVRLEWDYQILSEDQETLHISAQVTLVAVDRATGKIMRRLSPALQEVFLQLAT